MRDIELQNKINDLSLIESVKLEDQDEIITAALPYVNNAPHLGNIIGCVLSADIYNRYRQKTSNKKILFICGTDEYGTATEIQAIKQNITPKELCDINFNIHKAVYSWLGIEFSNFGRTSCQLHIKNTQNIFLDLLKNNNICEQEIEQFFCEGCSIFLSDRYVRGTCPNEKCKLEDIGGDQCDKCGLLIKATMIIDPVCSLCIKTPVIKKTKHLFIKLDEFRKKLVSMDKTGFSKIASEITKDWLDRELTPRCISRNLSWGVPIPEFFYPGINYDDYKDKVFYVWFDAPIGYITFTEEILSLEPWMSEDWTLTQFMGKDNVAFHSIFFPAMLFGTEKYKLIVKNLSSTEYLLFEGKKFSKSRGHGIFGTDLLNEEVDATYWRYYLAKIRPETKDSNFTLEDFQKSINHFINTFGNLCNRILKAIKKTKVSVYKPTKKTEEFTNYIEMYFKEYKMRMEKAEIRRALEVVLEICYLANAELQKAVDSLQKDERNNVFCMMFSVVIFIGHLLEPFVPKVVEKLFKMCGILSRVMEMKIYYDISIGEVDILMHPLKNEDLEALHKKYSK
ncbi:putative methionine--tRNA ligase, cytoplasmic [Cucumispora dikerogammari]|nr:putative methionine--tRNA ligase, cytoplasmic [Cucumispora dikerogammari]